MGNCGGPLDPALVQIERPYNEYPDGNWEGARIRDGVVEISGSRVMRRPSVGMFGASFTSCPVAAAREPWLDHVFATHRAIERGYLPQMEPAPSAALLDAADLVHRTLNEVLKYEAEARAAAKAKP